MVQERYSWTRVFRDIELTAVRVSHALNCHTDLQLGCRTAVVHNSLIDAVMWWNGLFFDRCISTNTKTHYTKCWYRMWACHATHLSGARPRTWSPATVYSTPRQIRGVIIDWTAIERQQSAIAEGVVYRLKRPMCSNPKLLWESIKPVRQTTLWRLEQLRGVHTAEWKAHYLVVRS